MSEKKENREEEKERNSSLLGLTDEQIEAALNACTFGYLREKCRYCPLDSEKEPCITNLHLAALEYIRRLKHRAEVAEKSLEFFDAVISNELMNGREKELAEERKDENI